MCGVVKVCLWYFCNWKTPWNYCEMKGFSSLFLVSISSRYDLSCWKRRKTQFLPSIMNLFLFSLQFLSVCVEGHGSIFPWRDGDLSHDFCSCIQFSDLSHEFCSCFSLQFLCVCVGGHGGVLPGRDGAVSDGVRGECVCGGSGSRGG